MASGENSFWYCFKDDPGPYLGFLFGVLAFASVVSCGVWWINEDLDLNHVRAGAVERAAENCDAVFLGNGGRLLDNRRSE